jgi:hypothetical protein
MAAAEIIQTTVFQTADPEIRFYEVPRDQFVRYRDRFAGRRQFLTPEAELPPTPHAAHPADSLTAKYYLAIANGGFWVATGFGITSDGELISLFNAAGKGKGYGDLALAAAVKRGARKLSAFDGFLPKYYAERGWVEVGRVKFDPALRPELWIPRLDGTPDVVFMEYQPPKQEPELRNIESGYFKQLVIDGRREPRAYTNEAAEQASAALRRDGAVVDVRPLVITTVTP